MKVNDLWKRVYRSFYQLIPVLLVFALYAQVWNHDYISFDDPQYTYENPIVEKGLSYEGLRWAFQGSHFANYHPLTWISHMIDFSIFGNQPGCFAFENAILHALNVLLVSLLLGRLFKDVRAGLIGGLIFAGHPILVEAVAWISQRKTLISTTWAFGSLLLYLAAVDRCSQRERNRAICFYAGSVACFYISLLFKSMFVTLPALLLLIECIDANTGAGLTGSHSASNLLKKWRVITVRLVPYALGSLVFAVIAIWSQSKGGAVAEVGGYGYWSRIETAVIGYSSYIWKFLSPSNLSVFYPLRIGVSITEILIRGFVLLGISTCFYMLRTRLGVRVFVGWMIFLVSLLPVIGLVQIGAQSYADRYLYGPILGLIIMVVSLALQIAQSNWPAIIKRLLGVAFLGWIVAFSMVCSAQIENWKNDFFMARSILEIDGDNLIGSDLMAGALLRHGHYQEASNVLRSQISKYPNHSTSYSQLALCLFLLDKREEALIYQQQFIDMTSRKGPGLVNMAKFLFEMEKEERVMELIHFIDNHELDLSLSELKILSEIKNQLRGRDQNIEEGD